MQYSIPVTLANDLDEPFEVVAHFEVRPFEGPFDIYLPSVPGLEFEPIEVTKQDKPFPEDQLPAGFWEVVEKHFFGDAHGDIEFCDGEPI